MTEAIIAFKIATAPVLMNGEYSNEDMPGFRDGFVLNLLNPKAYAAFFVLFSQFLLPFETTPAQYFAASLVIFVVAIVVDCIWLVIGSAIRSFFPIPGRHEQRVCYLAYQLLLRQRGHC